MFTRLQPNEVEDSAASLDKAFAPLKNINGLSKYLGFGILFLLEFVPPSFTTVPGSRPGSITCRYCYAKSQNRQNCFLKKLMVFFGN